MSYLGTTYTILGAGTTTPTLPHIPAPPTGLSQTQVGIYFAGEAFQILQALQAADPANHYGGPSIVQQWGEAELIAWASARAWPSTDVTLARLGYRSEWQRLVATATVGIVWVPNPYFLWLGRTVLENQANILYDGLDPTNSSLRMFQTTAGTWRWDPTATPGVTTPTPPTKVREWVQAFVDELGPKRYTAQGFTLYATLAWRVVTDWSNGTQTWGQVYPWSGAWLTTNAAASGVGAVTMFRLDRPWLPDSETYQAIVAVLGQPSVTPPAITPGVPVTPPTPGGGGVTDPLPPIPDPGDPWTNTGGGGGPTTMPPPPGTEPVMGSTWLIVAGVAAVAMLGLRGRR